MEKIHPIDHEGRYRRWKTEQNAELPGVPHESAEQIRALLRDLERGVNVSRGTKRGPRGAARLMGVRNRLAWLAKQFQAQFDVQGLSEVTEEQVLALIADIEAGVICKRNGDVYRSASDFVKDFKTFWHWHMRVQHKAGTEIPDITMYLAAAKRKPPWVYLEESDVHRLCAEAKFKYRVLMMFLLDSGVRSPSELMNIRLRDLSTDWKSVQVREETSKTFGRQLKLLLSSELLREHVSGLNLAPEDPVFAISPAVVNRYLKRLAVRVLGDRVTRAGGKCSELTMYDFRHISACYWLPRYKSESAMKYRFGWKKTERIHYYTELLGMRDTIQEQDVSLAPERTDLERRFAESERQRKLLEEQIQAMQRQLQSIAEVSERLVARAEVSVG